METTRRQLQRLSLALALWLGWTCASPTIASPQRSAQRLTISGTVLNNEGRPLAGATVSLAPVMDDYDGYDLRLGEGLWAQPVATAETATDGRYTLSAASGRRWRLIVEHAGRVTVTRRLEPLFEDREVSAARLRPAHPLEVRVKTVDGVAVANARVMAHSVSTTDDSGSDFWPDSWVAGTTDNTGRARLSVPQIGPWNIEVMADGLTPVRVEHAGAASATVELAGGSRLDLRLRLASGKPAAAAMAARPLDSLTLAKADAQGRVVLFGKPGSRQPLRILTADGAALETEVKFPARGQRAARRTLELLPPNQLTIQVVTAETLDPVADAVAWGRDDHVAFGDAQGRLTLTQPATEPWISLSLAAPHHLLWKQRRVPISLAREQTLTVGLEPAASLGGKVVDSDGHPLEDVAIWVKPKADPFDSNRFRLFSEGRGGQTGVDGHFAITSLPPAAQLDLVARKAGFATAYLGLDALRLSQVQSGVEVILTAGRSAIGTVVDEAMRPVAGASVELFRRHRDDGDSSPDPSQAATSTGVTDAAGQFELPDLGAGRFDLRVSAAGFVVAKVPGLEISDGAGGVDPRPVDLGPVNLQHGMRLAGRVVDENNLPVGGAEVQIGKAGDSSFSSREGSSHLFSDAEGRFEFVDRAAGSYKVQALSAGYLVAESDRLETPLEAPIVLLMRRGAELVGRVVDGRGNAIVGAQVKSQEMAEASRSVRAICDETGHFKLVGLGLAGHELTFEAPGFESQRRKVQILPNPELEPLEVMLERRATVQEPSATVSGQVQRADGRPVPGVAVQVRPVDAERSRGRTNSSGQFEIDEVPRGPAVVVARLNLAESREKINVELGRNLVSLTLPPGVEVSGWVSDADGEPVPSALVKLRPSIGRGDDPNILSDKDGSFTFTDVAPGTYKLEVRHPDYAAAKLDCVVTTEPIAGLQPRLSRGAVVSGHLDGLDLDALSAVRVSLKGRPFSYSAAPNHKGQFRFEHVLPGKYRAEAKLARRVLATGEFQLPAEREELEIKLLPLAGIDLRGRVLQGGKGVGNARVHVVSKHGIGAASYTTADGQFVLHGVHEGPQQLRVKVLPGNGHRRQIEVREGQEVVFELPTGEISGRVFDADSGESLAGVEIDLVTLREVDLWSDGWLKRGDGWQIRTDHSTTSDSMGVFVLREVAGGRYRLRVKHGDYGPVMTELEVGPVPLRDVDIALGPSDGLVLRPSQDTSLVGTYIRVALLDQSGRMVLLNNQKVGADGKTHIASPPTGEWQLWVSSANSAWARINVQIPSEEVPVALTPGSTVVFKVPELGEEMRGLTVSLRSPDGRPLPAVLGGGTVKSMDDMGYVGNLWPGQWSLDLRHEDGRTWRADFTIRAGETTSLELR